MTLEILQSARVIDMISKCSEAGIVAEWFVFGSVSRDEPLPEDIDLLCVVDNYDEGAAVLAACDDFLLHAPIHLRILSRLDESLLHFAERSNALRIADLL